MSDLPTRHADVEIKELPIETPFPEPSGVALRNYNKDKRPFPAPKD